MGDKMMMDSVVLVKAQPDAAVDPVPSAVNGLETTQPQYTLNGVKVDDKTLRASLSPRGHSIVAGIVGLKFDIYLKGSGVVGQDPKWMPAFLAGGNAKTVIVAVPVGTPAGTFVLDETVTGVQPNVPATGTADGGNAGENTMTAVADGGQAKIGTYTVTCIDDSVSGSEVWEVEDPDGNLLANAVTAVAYSSDQIDFLINDPGVDAQEGDIFTVAVTNDGSGATAVVRAILTDHLLLSGVTGGPFLVTDKLQGGTSNAVVAINSVHEKKANISGIHGVFTVGSEVTCSPSTETGTVEVVGADYLVLSGLTGDISADTSIESDDVPPGTATITSVEDAEVVQPGSMLMPIKTDVPMCAFYWYLAKILHKGLAARSDISLTFLVNDRPTMSLTLTGNFVQPADVEEDPVPEWDENEPPIVQGVNLQIDTFTTPVVEKLTVNYANSISPSNSMIAPNGIKEIKYRGRSPKGSIDPEVENLSVFNPWVKYTGNSKFPIQIHIPGEYGHQIAMLMPLSQLDKDPGYADKSGQAAYSLPFVPTGKEDEIRLFLF